MRTIVDCETEIEKWGGCALSPDHWQFAGLDDCSVLVRTTASLTATKRLMRIEQRCFFRRGDALPDQPWGRPDVRIESALSSEQEIVETVKQMHAQFLSKIRAKLAEGSMI